MATKAIIVGRDKNGAAVRVIATGKILKLRFSDVTGISYGGTNYGECRIPDYVFERAGAEVPAF